MVRDIIVFSVCFDGLFIFFFLNETKLPSPLQLNCFGFLAWQENINHETGLFIAKASIIIKQIICDMKLDDPCSGGSITNIQ